MSNDNNSPYGTLESEPTEKSGVEVGGGDKAAAAHDRKAREEGEAGGTPSAKDDEPNPSDEDEAQSPT